MTDPVLETSAQAQERDRWTIDTEGIPSPVLMENAARALCRDLEKRMESGSQILILCGPGSNGQDGLAMLRVLREHGRLASAFCQSKDTLQNRILSARHIDLITDPDKACRQMQTLQEKDWVVDAMFGSGLSRPLQGQWAKLAAAANDSKARILAVDVPSGIHGETGVLGEVVIKADVTAAIGTRKLGTVLPASLPFAGRTVTLDIGLGTPDTARQVFELTRDKAAACLPARPDLSWKGTFGRALMTGGSSRMHGAIEMAASACFHSGIGLLSAAVPQVLEPALRCRLPEAMLVKVEGDPDRFSEESIEPLLETARTMTVVSAGNGMGREPGTAALVKALLQETTQTLVLDADALSVLDTDWLNRQAGRTILTPHPGEFCRMTSMDSAALRANPVCAARDFSLQWPQTVLVLKGDITCVAENGIVYVLDRPDSKLAKGGSGDLLCGIITGLAGSQEPFEAALCGVWAHNRAAALCTKDPAAFTPQDLIDSLSGVWSELRKS